MLKKPLEPKFITDSAGQKLVILTLQEFDSLIDEMEEFEDIELYNEAKRTDDGERILFSDYLKNRKEKNGSTNEIL